MRALPLALATSLLLAACGSDNNNDDNNQPTPTPEETGRLTIQLTLPQAPDPMANVERFYAALLDGETVVAEQTFSVEESVQLLGLQPGTDLTFVLEGLDASDAVVSRGVTLPFDLAEENGQSARMYFAQTDVFSQISGSPSTRVGAAVVELDDGRVLIAGGEVDGSVVATAELYDPTTDTVTALPDMNNAHADTPAVIIDDNVVLVAAGRGTGGTATGEADVFVYDPTNATGTWETVPALATARTDAGIIGLGAGHAVVAGGFDGASNALDTVEVFEWDGGAGAWTVGPVLSVERAAPAAFRGAEGVAFIAGGFTGGNGANAYAQTTDRYTWNAGGGTIDAAADISSKRGYCGVVRLEDGSVLLAGGREGNSDTVTATTERIVINGGALSSNGGQNLPSPRANPGGGVMGDGRVLVLGGTSGTLPGAPVDDTLLYDPSSGGFSPLGTSPGTTSGGRAVALPDGTTLVSSDAGVYRYNPPAP